MFDWTVLVLFSRVVRETVTGEIACTLSTTYQKAVQRRCARQVRARHRDARPGTEARNRLQLSSAGGSGWGPRRRPSLVSTARTGRGKRLVQCVCRLRYPRHSNPVILSPRPWFIGGPPRFRERGTLEGQFERYLDRPTLMPAAARSGPRILFGHCHEHKQSTSDRNNIRVHRVHGLKLHFFGQFEFNVILRLPLLPCKRVARRMLLRHTQWNS